ncbi:MAG TPA: HAD-IIB family hydrolase [Acidisarcina sp.]
MPFGREYALPPSWQTSSAQVAWWDRVRSAAHSVLVLDYDGTLAPFTLDRMKSQPYAGVDERLNRLIARETVSVILATGRSWRELKVVYPTAARLEVWASHGREHATATGEYHFMELTAEQKTILSEVMRDPALAALPPDAVERKPASIAIHWRGLEPDEQAMLRKQVLGPFERHVAGGAVALLPFEDGVELRATGRTKGDAVRDIRAGYPADVPIAYLGDDHTDEEAFGAMIPEDLALLVRAAPRGTLASYWVPPPQGILDFLDRWIDESSAAETDQAEERAVATSRLQAVDKKQSARRDSSQPLVERRGQVSKGPVERGRDS